MTALRSQLRQRRVAAGLGQQELAARVGVARQTIGALEAGDTVPSTVLALELARVLECRVEELFTLAAHDGPLAAALPAGTRAGARLRVGLVRGRWVAHAADDDAAADALAAARGRLNPLRELDALRTNLLVAGCDPALGVLSGHLAETRLRMHWLELASGAALDALALGRVHVAGMHLEDAATGEHNVPIVRERFGGGAMVVVNLASWELGLVVRRRAGAPRRAAQLAARGVRVCAREPGSGARALLDRIAPGRLDIVEIASGHHAVARSVAHGAADVGVATAAAAAAFGLDFVPLATSRFDLVMATDTAASPSGARLIEVLSGRSFRRDAGALPGYSTADTGTVLARAA